MFSETKMILILFLSSVIALDKTLTGINNPKAKKHRNIADITE